MITLVFNLQYARAAVYSDEQEVAMKEQLKSVVSAVLLLSEFLGGVESLLEVSLHRRGLGGLLVLG
jgi:hypothetical protein